MSAPPPSPNPVSRRSVPRDASTWTQLLILKGIHERDGIRQIARHLNKPKSTIHRHVASLTDQGYLSKRGKGYYEVTSFGYQFLDKLSHINVKHDGASGVGGGVVRFEHFGLRWLVVRDCSGFLGLEGGVGLRGGVVVVDGELWCEGGWVHVRRWHTPRRDWIFIYSPVSYHGDAWEAIVFAGIRLQRVADLIQRVYGMVLSGPDLLQNPEFEFEEDPFAKVWMAMNGGNLRFGSDVWIDDSKRRGGELRFSDPKRAQRYIELPDLVERIGKNLELLAQGTMNSQQLLRGMAGLLLKHLENEREKEVAISWKPRMELFSLCEGWRTRFKLPILFYRTKCSKA